jgi:hypothetical protein
MLAVSAAATATIALGSGPVLLGALVVQGFVRNSVTPFLMLLMMESPAVGAAAMGAAGGLFFTVGEIGGFSGPSAMGLIFDLTGGFTLGLWALAAVLLAMAISCLGLEHRVPMGAERVAEASSP